jgi:hypothetical protein
MRFNKLPEKVKAVFFQQDRWSLMEAVNELDRHNCWYFDETDVTIDKDADFASS